MEGRRVLMIEYRKKKLCCTFILLICLFTLLVSRMAVSNKYEGEKDLKITNESSESKEIAAAGCKITIKKAN